MTKDKLQKTRTYALANKHDIDVTTIRVKAISKAEARAKLADKLANIAYKDPLAVVFDYRKDKGFQKRHKERMKKERRKGR